MYLVQVPSQVMRILNNPDVSNWDTSKVTAMNHMFSGQKNANPDVSNWDTSNVTSFDHFAADAYQANLDMSNFDFSNAGDSLTQIIGRNGISAGNYSKFLIRLANEEFGTSAENIDPGVSLNLSYCHSPETLDASEAYNKLAELGWNIPSTSVACIDDDLDGVQGSDDADDNDPGADHWLGILRSELSAMVAKRRGL